MTVHVEGSKHSSCRDDMLFAGCHGEMLLIIHRMLVYDEPSLSCLLPSIQVKALSSSLAKQRPAGIHALCFISPRSWLYPSPSLSLSLTIYSMRLSSFPILPHSPLLSPTDCLGDPSCLGEHCWCVYVCMHEHSLHDILGLCWYLSEVWIIAFHFNQPKEFCKNHLLRGFTEIFLLLLFCNASNQLFVNMSWCLDGKRKDHSG